ncbi:MAG TPA: hypothetical protein VF304_03685 [Casimicrobiaceae bacterium]
MALAIVSACGLAMSALSQADEAAGKNHHWYVNAGASPGGDGSIQSPFNSLAAVEQASSPNDTIVIQASPLGIPPLDGGIALKPGQRLVGEGPPVVQLGKPLLQGGPPLATSTGLATQPRIQNTSPASNNGDAVELADGADVENIVIATAYRGGIYGNDVIDVTVRGNDIGNFNTSGTVGFRVQPFYLNSYTAGLARGGPPPFGNGIGAGWAGILIDVAAVKTSIDIEGNYVHDGVCGDGIDMRSTATGNASAQVNRNFVTGLKQCSGTGVGTIEGIGTQVTGTGVLTATLDGNTEANTGSPGANMDSLFVNPAESGMLIESITHNAYTTGIGGASTNGMEDITSNGKPYSQLTISDSQFFNNPGDMLELFNRGEQGSTAVLILDHVVVDGTTISGGLPGYATPAGGQNGVKLASTGDNTGECLGIASVGSHDVTVLEMRDSSFTNCGNDGIEITNNHCTHPPTLGPACGPDEPHTVSIDIARSRIAGSRFYNLWMNDVTPLTQLAMRVEDTDLSTSQSGVAVALDQQVTGGTGSAVIDLGGGRLGSKGRNCIFGGAVYDAEAQVYAVSAENNWWGSPSGPVTGKVVANAGGSIDAANWLTHVPSTCNGE